MRKWRDGGQSISRTLLLETGFRGETPPNGPGITCPFRLVTTGQAIPGTPQQTISTTPLILIRKTKLGWKFRKPAEYTLGSVDDLRNLNIQGYYPIVYVDQWPIKGGLSGQYHSQVVISVGPERLTVLDPLVGESTVARLDFEAAWSQVHYLAIVISA